MIGVTKRLRNSALQTLLISVALLLTLFIGVAGAARTDEGRVIVYYFHSTVRCETCLMIETLADATLRAEFASELSNGGLVWRAIDVQRNENRHFVTDFGLSTNELIVVREKDGETVTFEKIPDLWTEASDPERLTHHLKDVVVRLLGQRQTSTQTEDFYGTAVRSKR